MRRISRMPKLADMIIEVCPDTGSRYTGLVHEIQLDTWGHQRCVLITWFGDVPQNYREEYGYAGVNIHNIRDRYEVIRKGKTIR